MPGSYFPLDGGENFKHKCLSGPFKIDDGIGRDSEDVPGGPGSDAAIVRAYKRTLDGAVKNALDQAAAAIKNMKDACDGDCDLRIVTTLSDYHSQEETGQSALGPINMAYLVSSEVDWTVEGYCVSPKPAEPPPKDHKAPRLTPVTGDVAVGFTSPSGGQAWIKTETVTNGCTTRKASGQAVGYGTSDLPRGARARAEEKAKSEAIDDATAQITFIQPSLRCDKRCKKQTTEIQMSNLQVSGHPTDYGYLAKATIDWVAYANCSPP